VQTQTAVLPSKPSQDLRKTGIHPDNWYPLALSSDLAPGKTLAVSFAGEPIVLVRPNAGDVFALEDRCAHRQVPLHKGVVKGERLQCGYHCWTYDRTGRCVTVPYLDQAQRLPNGIRSYPVREAYGFIFVFPGALSHLDHAPFPEVPTFFDPSYKTRFLDRRIACHYSFMHENLMDMNHQFLHRKLMGKIRPTLIDHRRGPGFVEARYTFARTSGRQSWGEKVMIGSGPKELRGHDKNLMVIRTDYPHQSLTFEVPGAGGPALDLRNFYVPVDREQRVNQTYGLMMIRKPRKMPLLLHALWPVVIWFTESIFAEDQDIVEQEQRAHDAQGEDWNQEIFPAILALKDLLTEEGVPLAS